VTVNSAPNIQISSSYNVCSGSSITLTANPTPPSGTNVTWAPGGSISNSISVSPTSTTIYTLTSNTGSGTCTSTDTQQITVKTTPITSDPGRYFYICQSPGNFWLKYTASSASTFTWYNSTSSGSFTGASINTDNDSLTSSYQWTGGNNPPAYWKIVVTNGGCTYDYFIDLITASGNNTITAPVIGSNQSYCVVSPNCATASVLRMDGSGSTFSYKWESSTTSSTSGFTTISGATSRTYNPGSVCSTTYYRLVISNSNSNCGNPGTSAAVTITVNSSLFTGNSISGTDCVNGAPVLTNSGTLSACSPGSYSYSWENSGSSSGPWASIPNSNSAGYNAPTAITSTTYYRRVTTCSGSGCSAATAAVGISPGITGNQIQGSYSICKNASASAFSVSGLAGGTGSYSYQWQSAPDLSGSPGGYGPVGTNSSSYTPSTSAAGTTWYRVVVTSGNCTSTSNASQVTVNDLPTISAGSNVSVCQGSSVTLTATGGSTYSWSPNNDLNVTSGAVVISTPTATRTYTITGTDANGCVNTGTVTVTLNTLPTAPTSNGTTTSNQCYSGSVPSIDLNTTFITGTVSSPLAYQWFTESTNPPVSAPVTNPTTTAGTYYAFTRNTSTGCFSSTSITATLNYINNAAPVPLTNSFTACSPATYNLLSAEPTAPSGTTWEWQTSATYNTANAVGTPTAVSSGTYYLYGRNSTCTTASAAVTVTINSLPLSSVTVSVEAACYPNKVNISDNYTNTGAIYQWYTVNSNPSPATLVTDPTSVGGDSGTTTDYYLYVTNPTTLCRSSSAAAVAVTINKRPKLNIASPALSCEGSSVNIVGSSNLAATYQWYTVNTTTGSATSLSNSSPYSNVTTNTLSVNPTTGLSSNLFYFTATSTTGSCLSTSDMVPIPLQTNVSCATQPSSKFVGSLPGGTFFSFTVDDFNAEIQWQVSTNGGGSWRNILGTGGNNATLYYGYNTTRLDLLTVHDSMNNFQYRAIATTSPCTIGCTTNAATLTTPISLPVSGMKLVGTKTGQHLELRWFVLSEEDVQYYQVEYAENGRDFVPMGKVFVANPSFTSRSYNYLVPLKKGYYRIQATSERLASVYSNLYWYNATDAIKTGINPNPVQAEKGIMQLSVSGVDHEIPFKVNVHGVDGRLIQSAEMMMQTGTHAFRLSENALSGSIVILSIVHPDLGVIERRKVVIQH
jgi:hypothetical protein